MILKEIALLLAMLTEKPNTLTHSAVTLLMMEGQILARHIENTSNYFCSLPERKQELAPSNLPLQRWEPYL